MPAPAYRFLTRWRVLGTVEEVSAILGDAGELPRWWPGVYLRAEELEAGNEDGIGKRVRVHTKGWLPYTLDWDFRVTASRRPHGFSIEATGDLAGEGDWRFEQDGAWTAVTYDWRVRAEKPLLRILSPLLRPLLEYNHRWAMARGEESLRLELSRQRCATPSERARIPAPPPPTAVSAAPLIASGLAVGAAAFLLARTLGGRRRRRRR
jgi:Polyketide cyclase / dehydrase and lipid transport